MSKSYLVKVLMVISDAGTKAEIHSETVGFFFKDCESKYFRGLDKNTIWDHHSLAHWLRSNTGHMITHPNWKDNIFRTNNQRKKLDELTQKIRDKKSYVIDSVVVETDTGTTFEVKLRLDQLKKDPANIFWQGEFV